MSRDAQNVCAMTIVGTVLKRGKQLTSGRCLRLKSSLLGSLSTRVFKTRTATGSEYFARQDSGLSQIFKLRVSNSEKILIDINVVV